MVQGRYTNMNTTQHALLQFLRLFSNTIVVSFIPRKETGIQIYDDALFTTGSKCETKHIESQFDALAFIRNNVRLNLFPPPIPCSKMVDFRCQIGPTRSTLLCCHPEPVNSCSSIMIIIEMCPSPLSYWWLVRLRSPTQSKSDDGMRRSSDAFPEHMKFCSLRANYGSSRYPKNAHTWLPHQLWNKDLSLFSYLGIISCP